MDYDFWIFEVHSKINETWELQYSQLIKRRCCKIKNFLILEKSVMRIFFSQIFFFFIFGKILILIFFEFWKINFTLKRVYKNWIFFFFWKWQKNFFKRNFWKAEKKSSPENSQKIRLKRRFWIIQFSRRFFLIFKFLSDFSLKNLEKQFLEIFLRIHHRKKFPKIKIIFS